ncbi:hypothetical protein MUA41_00670 [Staphylococcus simulans]|nr:hypothetical protein [Staphylococcus simulans]UXR38014.1 hypothetical protein MUA41_00670 [Staphylococcus simulans]
MKQKNNSSSRRASLRIKTSSFYKYSMKFLEMLQLVLNIAEKVSKMFIDN